MQESNLFGTSSLLTIRTDPSILEILSYAIYMEDMSAAQRAKILIQLL